MPKLSPADLYRSGVTPILEGLCKYAKGCTDMTTQALADGHISEENYSAFILEVLHSMTASVPFLLGHCEPGEDRIAMLRQTLAVLQSSLNFYCIDESFTVELHPVVTLKLLN